MSAHRSSERGQILVLVILAIVAIFGFTALAVDGGSVVNQRRASQSAADAATLAAGMEFTNSGDLTAAVNAALAIAETNGYNNDGVTNTVEVFSPPVSGPYKDLPLSGSDRYFQVRIWVKLEPVFAQMMGINNEEVTTEAVAHAKPVSAISTGNAVHCLSHTSNCLNMNGSTNIYVDGGNIFSNGDGTKHGAAGEVRTTGGGEILITGGFDCTGCKPGITVVPTAIENFAGGPQDIKEPPVPYCPNHDEYDAARDVHYYYHGSEIKTSTVLQPGFHCIYDGIKLTGGDKLTGHDVVLVIMGGVIDVVGNSAMELSRPNSIIDKNGRQYGGLLIYVPSSNPGKTFKLCGTSDSFFTGTILAPKGECEVGGNSTGTGMHTNVICNTVFIHGGTDFNVTYNEDDLFKTNAEIELVQ